jgi:hypothetical protein
MATSAAAGGHGGAGGGGGSSKHGTSTKHATAKATKKHGKERSAKQIAAEKKWQAAGTKAEAAKIKGHHRKHTKARGLAVGDGVMCCSAEALAASLRLTGATVTDADVFTLYQSTLCDPGAGASILATLEAACRFGLAGIRPVSFAPVMFPRAGDLLGVTLPAGPHSLTLDASGAVWTWGWLGDLDDLAAGPVEEAWVISWL